MDLLLLRRLPVDVPPDSHAGVMWYASDSRALRDLEGMAGLGSKGREQLVAKMWMTYRLGRPLSDPKGMAVNYADSITG